MVGTKAFCDTCIKITTQIVLNLEQCEKQVNNKKYNLAFTTWSEGREAIRLGHLREQSW